MANTTIPSELLADGSVATAKIADDAITLAKLNVTDGTNGQVLKTDGSGNLSFTTISATPGTYDVDFLVIGGGGAGTDNNAGGGGGGAGGYRTSWNSETSGGGSSAEPAYKVTEGTVYNIIVGSGGVAAPIVGQASDQTYCYKGTDSVFGSIRSLAGGASQIWGGNEDWLHGGSGCGGTRDYARGNGTTGQGYSGGAGSNSNGFPGGGGGGAGAEGGQYASYDAGDGRDGLASTITGSSVTRGGGGGGGT